jgi:hypothetical protein
MIRETGTIESHFILENEVALLFCGYAEIIFNNSFLIV